MDGTAGFDGQVVEVRFPCIGGESAFQQKAAKIAVGADIVEAVVMDPDMGHVGGHAAEGSLAPDLEHVFISGGVVLEDGGTIDKAFGPFGPATGGVFSCDGEDGRSI